MKSEVYPTLFDTGPTFSGPDIEAEDIPRLIRQLDRVEDFMRAGLWRTLAQIAFACGCSEASASARLRDLRNKLNYTVERRRDEKIRGLWYYRAIKGN